MSSRYISQIKVTIVRGVKRYKQTWGPKTSR